jgi:hypothetical protein
VRSILLRKIPASDIANSSDPKFRVEMMRKTVMILRDQGELWLPLLLIIGEFLDGLAKPPKNEVKKRYTAYLETYFPSLCQALGGGATGAERFYDNFRVKAAHEFAVNPPFGIDRDQSMKGVYAEEVLLETTGEKFTALNIDRLTEDFLKHLHGLPGQ